MKNILCVVSSVALLAGFISCDDMYSIHEKYLETPEKTYIGYPDISAARGGFERIELSWKLNQDPKIKQCCIYWNDKADSLIVPPDRTDTIMRQIIPLPEGSYVFEMINRDDLGNTSLTQVISGRSYGENFKSSLVNMSVSSQEAKPDSIVLTWGLRENCIGTDFKYVNKNGEDKEVFLPGDQTNLVLKDYVPGGEFSYHSLYVPEVNAIDTVAAEDETGLFVSYYSLTKEEWEEKYHANFEDLDRSSWTVSASSEELTGEGDVNGRANTILDGDLNTFWHSQWQAVTAPLPHTLEIDMKEIQTISSIELARRQSNKDTKTVRFSVSSDGNNWVEVATVVFPADTNPNSKVVMFPNKIKGRFLKLILPDSNKEPSVSISEIYLTK